MANIVVLAELFVFIGFFVLLLIRSKSTKVSLSKLVWICILGMTTDVILLVREIVTVPEAYHWLDVANALVLQIYLNVFLYFFISLYYKNGKTPTFHVVILNIIIAGSLFIKVAHAAIIISIRDSIEHGVRVLISNEFWISSHFLSEIGITYVFMIGFYCFFKLSKFLKGTLVILALIFMGVICTSMVFSVIALIPSMLEWVWINSLLGSIMKIITPIGYVATIVTFCVNPDYFFSYRESQGGNLAERIPEP